ncbi:uncharacterized protein AKAME5_000564600 [Lates japonicus]|uniref:Uncharacterized protein n=1 Tax=Lates japonicus TaxID=270547 RepID=A0AAD3MFU3_LATJO|nr:uncharacterized protein AKAME5_000564600 [Lates japonicus]
MADYRHITPVVYAAPGQLGAVECFLLQEPRKSREEVDREIQERSSEAEDKKGTAQHPFRASMELVKPENGQQPLPELADSGGFLCESTEGNLLLAEHMICNPYTPDTEGQTGWGESEESWENHTTSPLTASCLLLHSLGKQVTPNPLLPCQAEAGEEDEEEEGDKGCSSMHTIQEGKLSTGSDGIKQQPDSRLGCRVRTAWTRWVSLWLKRKFTFKTFTNQNLTNPKESTKTSFRGLWRWLTFRHLLLHNGSEHPHLEAGDLHIGQSAVQSVHPRFTSSSTMLRNSFLDDGEDRGVGTPSFETRLNPLELPASDTSQVFRDSENKRDENRPPGSWDMFRALHYFTTPKLRASFGKELYSDMEELLVEDEDDDGSEDTDSD